MLTIVIIGPAADQNRSKYQKEDHARSENRQQRDACRHVVLLSETMNDESERNEEGLGRRMGILKQNYFSRSKYSKKDFDPGMRKI